jgi:hypothetical protein
VASGGNLTGTLFVFGPAFRLATTDRGYGTDDFSGVIAAKLAAKKGTVYVIEQDDVNLARLREAGFRTVHVHGALHELIAPTDEPSAKAG